MCMVEICYTLGAAVNMRDVRRVWAVVGVHDKVRSRWFRVVERGRGGDVGGVPQRGEELCVCRERPGGHDPGLDDSDDDGGLVREGKMPAAAESGGGQRQEARMLMLDSGWS